MTTMEQKEAWQAVHKALVDYYTNFGPIEVGEEGGVFFLDWDSEYPECGKIRCSQYRFSIDRKSFPWYDWIEEKVKGWKKR